MEEKHKQAIRAHAAFIDRLHELPNYLNVSAATFWDSLGLTEEQAEEIQHQGLFMFDAYHVLTTFPQVNPVWLLMGFGKPLLHGYEAELGAATLLDSLETKEVLLEFNDRRIKELERDLLIATAKKDVLFEAITALAKTRHLISAKEFEALLEKLESLENVSPQILGNA